MNRNKLFNIIKKKESFLCVGLDSNLDKIPSFLKKNEDAVFEFNKKIIDATHSYTVAYKPNTAFYECRGSRGWESLQKTVDYIRENYPDIFIIADAKRGDIGNTSKMYAKAFFELMNFDAITVAPYMGEDSVAPFFGYQGKWLILLALTSNKGADDFQQLKVSEENELFKEVIKSSQKWGNEDNMMYVVGATKAEMLKEIRKIAADNFLLVPGVGAQGGSLEEVAKYGMNKECGLLVNSSRGIIFADNSEKFAETAKLKAKELQEEMAKLLKKNNLIS